MSEEFLVVNKTTNITVFKGDMSAFKMMYGVLMFWTPPEEFLKNWASAAGCDVYKKV